MARQNTICTTVDPKTVANPTGVCPGTIIRYDAPQAVPVTIGGKTYNSYERCQRCGQVFPG